MTHAILNNTGSRLELNTLFIQPTRWCGLDCPGCYVKEHTGDETSEHIDRIVWKDLFNKIFLAKELLVNQVTLAADDPPCMYLGHNTNQGKQMREIFQSFISAATASFTLINSPTEYHVTFNSLETFYHYRNYLHAPHLAKSFQLISFSNIDDLEAVKDLARFTHINYNHLIPKNVTSQNIDRYVKKLKRIGEIVDSIYLVVHKTPVGAPRNHMVELKDRSRMHNDLSYIRTMMERLPNDIKAKIYVDGCIKDVVKFRQTGFGCSSNVSRFQVWPDGTVSGCPYAFNSTRQNTARNCNDILDNIRAARKRYDFTERCQLPSVYDSVIKHGANQTSKIQSRLRILA